MNPDPVGSGVFFFDLDPELFVWVPTNMRRKNRLIIQFFYFLFVPVPKFFCIVSLNALPSWLNLLLHRFYKFTTLVKIIAVESGTQKKIVSGNEINHSGFTTPPKPWMGTWKKTPYKAWVRVGFWSGWGPDPVH